MPKAGTDQRCSIPTDLSTESCYSGDAIDRSLRLLELQQSVDETVAAHGIYHPDLIHAHAAIAGIFSDQGAHDTALKHLTQALEVARANDGLYGESQLAILDRMVAALNYLGDRSRALELNRLRWQIERKLYPSPDWDTLEYDIAQVEALRQRVRNQSSPPTIPDPFLNLDNQLEAVMSRLDQQQDLDERLRLGIQLERVETKIGAIKRYTEAPREFFKPFTRLIGVTILDSTTSSKRRELREYVDSIYPVMSDIRATAQTSETLSETDRQNLARMLGEFNDEIEKFKSDWSHIFNDS